MLSQVACTALGSSAMIGTWDSDSPVTMQVLKADTDKKIKAVAVVHNEKDCCSAESWSAYLPYLTTAAPDSTFTGWQPSLQLKIRIVDKLALDQQAEREEALAKEQSLPSAGPTMTLQGAAARPTSSCGIPGKADSRRRPRSGRPASDRPGRDGGAGHRSHMAPGCRLGAQQPHLDPATQNRCAPDHRRFCWAVFEAPRGFTAASPWQGDMLQCGHVAGQAIVAGPAAQEE